MQTSNATSLTSRHVAVIGAGASGLVAARELRREGHQVVVFEKDSQIGGTWVYTPQVETDPLGLDPTRQIVHSSLYKSLRTNLPRESMGFMDYPFVPRAGEGSDPRRFPGHAEVLKYLQDFAREFGIGEMVRFECEVVSVEMVDNKKLKVESKRRRLDGDDDLLDEVFDAVVVCNGHFTQPRIAEIPGINLWPGKQTHSHNYRTPEPFRDKVVILIGSSASALDISLEIGGIAKEVHIASRSVADDTCEKQAGCDNIWLHSMIESAHKDGSVAFRDGNSIVADIILHCTGYKYCFPFLKTNGIVTVDDNRVGPLYKHVFPPIFAPQLSFVGLPYRNLPFPSFEIQSKWIAGVLSDRIVLPSQEDMMEDVNTLYSTLEDSGVPKHHTHNMGDTMIDYSAWVASLCQCPCFEEWRIQMFYETVKRLYANPKTLRDEWEDDNLLLQAREDFSKYI
ncbi:DIMETHYLANILINE MONOOXYGENASE [Salix purpurea]|uniref:Flavin-containing monooxygenase n=1 Tax=Salix purpurea TaxID=77065 RepID=A0A9Q0TIL0_SALPP|nr:DIMETHYLANILINE MONOOXYGENASE [Salix purpurea]